MTDIDHELPPKTIVDNYTITRTLGGGGFSIVYLAKDNTYNKEVVIKEYMPTKLATRTGDLHISALNSNCGDKFGHGQRLFFQEANTLSNLKHPNIVNVISFFRANGTVYMVMEYEEGINLQSYIKRHNGNMSEQFLMAVFIPLLGGLKTIHQNGLLHLDVKPSNIHLRDNARPLLLDFGAAHEMMQTRQFQANQVVTPGFSPIEQLDPGGYVGPWTDIYAIGATIRACIEGSPPLPSTKRRERDTLKPAVNAFKKKYSKHLLRAIDWSMEVDPILRPQNIENFVEALNNTNTKSGR